MEENSSPPKVIKCLASATFVSDDTQTICGQIWLLSANPELVQSMGNDDPLPNVFSARFFDFELGVVTDTGFGDSLSRVERRHLDGLLSAIRTADVARLYAMDVDYVPFYCPKCRASYDYSSWETCPVFDDGFYDYLEAECPKGHKLSIQD